MMSDSVSQALSFLLSPGVQAGLTLLGGFGSFVFGGYSSILGAALMMAFLDFLTGYVVSAWEGRVCSWKAGRGLIKKAAYFIVIASFYWVGLTTGMEALAIYFRDAAATAIVLTEFTSILENLYNAGDDEGILLPERVLKQLERVIDVRFAEITGREPMYKKLKRIDSQVENEEEIEELKELLEQERQ
jgi:toxin secretion/phage lysis holin